MSLLKINSRFLLTLFLTVFNYWMIKVFSLNVFLGILLVAVTVIISLNIKRTRIVVLCVVILLISQIHTTSFKNLVSLDNDQQRVQQERIRSYPPLYIDFYFKTLWLSPAKWIERNPLVILLSRVEENVFKSLNVNYYFFGGSPRNTPLDYEKIPFVLMPAFILGIYLLARKKEYGILFWLFLLPVFVIAIYGTENPYGLIALFPFLILSMTEGMENLSSRFSKKYFYLVVLPMVLLVFFMQINYVQN